MELMITSKVLKMIVLRKIPWSFSCQASVLPTLMMLGGEEWWLILVVLPSFRTNGRIWWLEVPVRKCKKPHQISRCFQQKPKEHSVANRLRYQFDALGGYSASNSCHQASTTTLGESNGSITTLFGMCRLGWLVILSNRKRNKVPRIPAGTGRWTGWTALDLGWLERNVGIFASQTKTEMTWLDSKTFRKCHYTTTISYLILSCISYDILFDTFIYIYIIQC